MTLYREYAIISLYRETQTDTENKMYTIGEIVWHRGRKITITTKPYECYGGMWQDGTDESGNIITVVTKEQKSNEIVESQRNWKRRQAGFARL